MKPVTDQTLVTHYAELFGEMLLARDGEEFELDPDWIGRRGWKVVPVESMVRIPEPDIPRIAAVLHGAGFRSCVAVFNEPGYIQTLPTVVPTDPPSDLATCYEVSISESDLSNVNRRLGPFRFLLSEESRSWAISCNETYNLFAAKAELLEGLLGRPLEQARREFLDFATSLGDDGLIHAAERYAVF